MSLRERLDVPSFAYVEVSGPLLTHRRQAGPSPDKPYEVATFEISHSLDDPPEPQYNFIVATVTAIVRVRLPVVEVKGWAPANNQFDLLPRKKHESPLRNYKVESSGDAADCVTDLLLPKLDDSASIIDPVGKGDGRILPSVGNFKLVAAATRDAPPKPLREGGT